MRKYFWFSASRERLTLVSLKEAAACLKFRQSVRDHGAFLFQITAHSEIRVT